MRVIRNSAAAALLGAHTAWAAPPPLSVPTAPGADQQGGYSGTLGDLQRTNFLLGDLFGLRTALAKYGVSLAIQETSEIQGNPIGGIRRGADYDGLTQAILQLYTQRAFGWYGGLFNISALQIHGRNLSTDNLASLQTSSGIQADRATRLWEAWYDQKFLDEDRADIKVGQLSVDQDFIASPNGAYFVNTMFGWPLVPSVDLPGGGPAYPLSNLGVRGRWRPVDPVTLLVGVFNGNPASTLGGDAQMANPSGTSLPLNGGTLVFAEVQYTYPAIGALVYPGAGAPLGHTYKIGMWYDTERFGDQRLLTPQGTPLQHRGDYSIYAVADQMAWRDQAFPNRSVSVFGRVMGTPEAARNLVDFSVNGGVVYHAPFATRTTDTVGLGFGWAHVSRQARAADADAAVPRRSSETFVELTYQYQVHPWWQLQPDLQYVCNPGGGIAHPLDPSQRVHDELALGLRTTILF